MTELKNVERELARFRMRLLAAAAFVLFGLGLVATRLVYLQIYRHEELATQAEANRIAVLPVVPNRGLIVDRNGIVLANNYSAYTLEVTPSKVADLEATIDALATLIDIQPRDGARETVLDADDVAQLSEIDDLFEQDDLHVPLLLRLNDCR